jgi:subtilisin family serine protease
MPASSIPPEEQPRVHPFDPLVLDRTVIAIPLLKAMEKECKLIEEFQRLHPELLKEYNAAIEYNPDFDAGLQGAVESARKLAEVAAQKALKASERRLLSSAEKLREFEQKRHADLVAAIKEQEIGPPLPDSHHGPGRLHASVVGRLMNESAALAESGETSEAPIRTIFPTRFEVIIDLNLEYPRGREGARAWVFEHIAPAKLAAEVRDTGQDVHHEKDQVNSQYVFARLEARVIRKLVEMDMAEAKAEAETRRAATENPAMKAQIDAARFRAIFHLWPDFEISACINKSIATVKADAAQNSFSARGAGITWAVMDSGIQQDHEHFRKYANVDKNSAWHKDFTVDGGGPFDDENGHGTHVAGIIAGEWRVPPEAGPDVLRPVAVSRYLKTETDDVEYQQTALEGLSGMAPRCKLVSLRVLDENGKGSVSNLIAAINHVQEINGYGRRILIHGVNMSLGYNFEPEWFACGQSPLCAEVDRLAKTGVVVVVAAGNTGYGTLKSAMGATSAGMALTINDPGNAELAITVGATHRDMPHVYGVSYFSSKGPTGDGRIKPDLVAPGEKIISCATGNLKKEGAHDLQCDYVETSGTSMAAPHVSGAIAAFLSVRMEFVGNSGRVKDIFMATATDLRRDRYFQGAGLVDLMRAIQSV